MFELVTAALTIIGMILGHFLGFRRGCSHKAEEVSRLEKRMEEVDKAIADGDAAALTAIFERLRREGKSHSDPGGQGN